LGPAGLEVCALRLNGTLRVDEPNPPASHAQPDLAPLARQHFDVAKTGLGKPFDGLLDQVPVAVR
jgi:hypothetical protein